MPDFDFLALCRLGNLTEFGLEIVQSPNSSPSSGIAYYNFELTDESLRHKVEEGLPNQLRVRFILLSRHIITLICYYFST